MFVNLSIPRYIEHELRNMIKTCIMIGLTTFISIHVNPLNMYIQLKLRCMCGDSLTTLYLFLLIS